MLFGSLSRLIAVRRLATMGPKKASGKAGKGKGSQSAKRERSNSPSDSAESSKKPRSGSRSPSPGSSRRGTKKFCTWNVNGVRAWIQKKGDSFIDKESPDVLCLQETKCSENSLPKAIKEVDGYYCYWLSGDKDGYSGVGLLTKEEPIEVTYGIGVEKHDKEGRVITAEYNKYYLIAAYVPNAGRGLVRLNYRMEWDKDFRKYLQKLDKVKPVILCGDLNVAHQEIDIHNPKTNKRNAGFTQEERDGFSDLLSTGFVDTFRHLYPDVTGAYTFWTYMFNARAKNVGWRLDYFVLSERLIPKVSDCIINDNVQGSDHCPVTLLINI